MIDVSVRLYVSLPIQLRVLGGSERRFDTGKHSISFMLKDLHAHSRFSSKTNFCDSNLIKGQCCLRNRPKADTDAPCVYAVHKKFRQSALCGYESLIIFTSCFWLASRRHSRGRACEFIGRELSRRRFNDESEMIETASSSSFATR